jgi:hypothetical protein
MNRIEMDLGVNLWNVSGLVRKCPDSDSRALVAARKFALSFF